MGLTVWDSRFLSLAGTIATYSKDPKTKVGCVIVDSHHKIVSTGFNGFPRGVNDDERLNDKSKKLLITLHAELNAVLTAERSLGETTAYVTHRPCCRCAAALIQSGVTSVVYQNPDREDWSGDDQELMKQIMSEAEVELVEIND